jgi:propionyl-CoA synthetase
MRKIADAEPYPMPATIDDPAVLSEIEQVLARSGYGGATIVRGSETA